MYLLDTSIVSNYLDERRDSLYLTNKILTTPPEQIFISVITVEEIVQGALANIQKVRKKSSIINAYQSFEELFEGLHLFQILPYTSEAEQIFQSLSTKVKRVGTQDCRIAAIARSKGYMVVTANAADFEKIGITQVEDWTRL